MPLKLNRKYEEDLLLNRKLAHQRKFIKHIFLIVRLNINFQLTYMDLNKEELMKYKCKSFLLKIYFINLSGFLVRLKFSLQPLS